MVFILVKILSDIVYLIMLSTMVYLLTIAIELKKKKLSNVTLYDYLTPSNMKEIGVSNYM